MITLADAPVDVQPRLRARERTFRADDGVELFYRAWMPVDRVVDRAVLLFHRGHEHSGRVADLASAFADDGFAVFAWDARGHGRSPGPRGYATHFAQLVRDVDTFARHVVDAYGIPTSETAVVAHSVSAVAVAAWVHSYAPPVRALVLATPALRVKLYVPLAVPALRVLRRIWPGARINSYVRPGMLTGDPTQAEAYRGDPLISRGISVNLLLGLHDAGTRLLADAGAIETPTLVMQAGRDYVVKDQPVRTFYERLGSSRKELRVYAPFRHAVFHEVGRDRVIADARRFVAEAFQRTAAPRQTAPAAHTRREYARLAAPARLTCPRAWSYRVTSIAMKTVGRLSDGIRLGWRTGFDSGQSLDHVYRNAPRGVSSIGTLIDRQYLNAVGWRGIRERRANLERALADVIDHLHAEGRRVRLLDVAAGAGRYALEAVKQAAARGVHVSAVLRDRSEAVLAAGRAIAAEMGVTSQVCFGTGDAFDPASIRGAATDPAPTIAVVSGLYELFDDNALVARSLSGIATALSPGGYLIYTNQPWHPQVEFIARVLTNRDGKPWVMRRRTQAEMDALVREAGFEKLRTAVDDDGIFTVSVAQKPCATSAGAGRPSVRRSG